MGTCSTFCCETQAPWSTLRAANLKSGSQSSKDSQRLARRIASASCVLSRRTRSVSSHKHEFPSWDPGWTFRSGSALVKPIREINVSHPPMVLQSSCCMGGGWGMEGTTNGARGGEGVAALSSWFRPKNINIFAAKSQHGNFHFLARSL